MRFIGPKVVYKKIIVCSEKPNKMEHHRLAPGDVPLMHQKYDTH